MQTVSDPAKREQHQPAAERDVGHAEDLAVRDQARIPREVKVGGATRESTTRKTGGPTNGQADRQAGRQKRQTKGEDDFLGSDQQSQQRQRQRRRRRLGSGTTV